MNDENSKNTLEQILKKFKILLNIIEMQECDDVQFAREQLSRDIETIYEVFEENISRTDYDEILHLVKRNYNRMYQARGGLTEFYIWRVDFYDRVKANEPLSRVKDELKVIFDKVN